MYIMGSFPSSFPAFFWGYDHVNICCSINDAWLKLQHVFFRDKFLWVLLLELYLAFWLFYFISMVKSKCKANVKLVKAKIS